MQGSLCLDHSSCQPGNWRKHSSPWLFCILVPAPQQCSNWYAYGPELLPLRHLCLNAALPLHLYQKQFSHCSILAANIYAFVLDHAR